MAAYLWELYAEVNQLFAENDELARQRRDVHKKIEEKIDPEYEACRYIAEQVLLDHIRTMERIGIHYDLLARESDVIALDFFKAAAAEMTARDVMIPLRRPGEKRLPGHPLRPGKHRQNHRPLQQHHHIRGKRHRLQPVEIQPSAP